MSKKIFFVLLGILIFISGCANYVTDKTITDAAGNKIIPVVKEYEFTITFRSAPAQNANYDYYLVISTENFRAITAAHTPEAYFFTPGEQYDNLRMITAYYNGDTNKNLQNVYNDYFSSWERFVRYNSTDVFNVFTGPFITSANHNTYQPTNLPFGNLGNSNQIKLRITVPYDDLWFNFLTVDESNVLRDAIDTNINFTYANGKVLQETADNVDPAINGGLDITAYTLRSYEY